MIRFFPWKRALHKKSVLFSLLVILTLGLVAVFAPWIAPHDPYRMTAGQRSLPPMWANNPLKSGVAQHPLGTDFYGRDVLSRFIYGTRTAFFLAMTAVPLAALLGALAGLVAGYAGGRVEAGILALADMIQSLPGIMILVILVLVFRGMLEPSWFNGLVTLVVGFVAISWVSLARLVRINVLLVKSQTFMEAATALGASSGRMIFRHLLPNVLHVVMVWIINNIPAAILMEAFLGYIGIGLTAGVDGGEFTVTSWGGLFFAGRSAINNNPLILVLPSLCILALSMSFYLIGDFLNDVTRHGQE